MASEDSERHELFDLLEAGIGTRGAALLMAHLPPVGWAELATKTDLDALGSELRGGMAELRGEMAELRGEMAELRAELKGEMAELRTELKGDMAELRTELKGDMAELRTELKGDMAELRATVDGQLPKLVAANIASMIGVAGLVLAAGAVL